MQITLLTIGKTRERYLEEGIREYYKKLSYYIKLSVDNVPETKNISHARQNIEESKQLLKKIGPDDYVILLDEKGIEYNSFEFASFLQKKFNSNPKRIVFVIGGPFGFSNEMYKRANDNVSLSRMTFSHDMARLFFVEQLYRAMTILKGEPYHH